VRAGLFVTSCLLLNGPEFLSRPLQAQSVCSPRTSQIQGPAPVSSIRVVSGVGTLGDGQRGTINQPALDAAAATWNAICASFLNPQLKTSGTGDITVNVFFFPGRNDGNLISGCTDVCGCADVKYNLQGRFTGANVFVFDAQSNGTSCVSTMAGVLAHELGHVLGLADARSPSCSGAIMGSPHGAVSASDCDAVDRNFWTGLEGTDPGHEEGPCGT
jgi:hypothetical protein